MKTKAFKKPLSILLTLAMVFGMFAMLGAVAGAEISGSTLVGRYFSTSSYTYDAVSHTDNVVLEGGPTPVFNHLLGMTYFDKAYVRLTRENIFADVTRDSGMTFAFNYRPGFEENHRHIVSIGQNNYGDGQAHHFFISGATAHNSSGNLPMVEWVSGSGETIAAYPDGVPQVEGREYNIVVVVDKDAGVVFYIDGEKKTTVYAGSDLNGQIGNVRSFLDEVHTYNKNYVGCSRWTGDTKIEGYLSDLRFYKAAASETEAYDLITDMATPAPQADQSALIGRYFSTDNVWYDAARGANGVQWQTGDFPVYNRSNGWTAFNNSMYVRIENEDLFANVTRDTGVTFAFDYIPKFSANDQFRHVVSIGQNAYGSGTANHLFISGAHTQHSSNLVQVTWVNGSGTELVNAYADGVPQVEGKEYSVVVSIDKDAGVVFYIDGVKRNTVYKNSSLNDQIGNIRSFLDEVHNYKNNYFGCSRWTADKKIDGLLRDVCIYKDTYTDDEIRAMLAARAAVPIDLSVPSFNATAYHYADVANGGYANLAYSSPATDNDSGMGIRGADGSDNYKNIGGANLKLFTPLQAVLVYDGARDAYVPIQLESKSANQTNISKSRIRYATSGSDTFTLKNDWQGYRDAEWKKWAADYTNTAASFSSSGGTESDYEVSNKNTPRFFWNAQKYSGTGNTEAYFDHVQNIRYDFKVYYDLSVGGTGDDYQSITTNSDYYILNYRPVYDVLSAAGAKYNGEMVGNKWMYTEASYAQAMLAMRHLTLSSPALYDYDARGAGFATRFCAGAIRQAAADYAAVNLVKKQGDVVFQKEDGTPIITVYGVNYGETVPAGSVPAIPAKSYDDTYHYVDARWDTDFSCISQPETVVTAAYTAVAHTWGWVTDQNPTCTAEGVKHEKCADCEAIRSENTPIEMAAHTYGELIPAVAPSCTEDGNIAYYECAVCHKTFDENKAEVASVVDAAPGHTYGELIPAVAPSCTVDGNIAYYECSVCHKTFDENKAEVASVVDAAPGHTYGELIPAVAPSCTEDGNIAYYECSVCHKTFDENKVEVASIVDTAPGHTYGELIPAVAPSCTEDGNIAYYECAVCHKTFDENKAEVASVVDAAPGHDYGELIPAVAPSCTEDGNIAYYECSVCHKTFDENKAEVASVVDAAPGHTYGELIPAVAPSCTEDGNIAYYECSVCHKTFDENKAEVASIVDAAPGHTYGELIPAVAPSCTVDGNIAYYECAVCHKTFDENKAEVASIVDAAPGHAYGELIPAVAPSCTVDGNIAYYECSVCHKTFDENKAEVASVVDAAPGHTYGELVAAVAPGCTVDGNIAYYECAVCHKTFDENKAEVASVVDAAPGHAYGELVAAVAPGCTEDGNIAYYECSVCHKTFDENKAEVASVVDAAAGHAYGELIPAVSPSCTVDGNIAYYECAVCHKTFDENKAEVASVVDAAPGHTYGELIPAVVPSCTVDGNIAYYECSVCHKTFDENKAEVASVVDAAPGHTYGELIPAVSPSCTVDGNIAYYECSVCHKTFDENKAEVASIVDAAPGHTYGELIPAVAPSCTVDGNIAYYECSVCHKTFDENKTEVASIVDAAPGHTYGELIPAVAPSCTVDGNIAYYECAVCHKTFDENKAEVASVVDAAPGHAYGELVAAVAPGCTEDGNIAYYECSVCHKTFDENKAEVASVVDPATNDHHYDVLQYDATNHWYKCANCDATTDPVAHSGGTATCTALAECGTCHQTYGEYNYNNHSTTETVTKDAVAAGYTVTGYTGDIYCAACDHLIAAGETIAKLNINENAVYQAAKELQEEAAADPDKYDAQAVAALNAQIAALEAAVAIDDNEEAVLAAIDALETIAESMGANILFTLTVNADNGTEATVVKGTAGSTADLGTPEKEGYEFKEWTVTAGSVSGTVYTFTDQNATATAVYTIKTGDAVTGAQAILDNAANYDDEYVAELSGKLAELNEIDASDPANNAAVKELVDAINALLEQADANRVYTVTFTVDGETVKTEPVKAGGSATPPEQAAYVIEGDIHGVFSGWTGDYTNVTADVTVSGVYAFTGHTWVDGDVTKPATCNETGTQAQSCVCGATNVKTLAIDSTAHDYGEWIDEISAGCTAEGTLGHYHCSVCGKDFDADRNVLTGLVIEKLAHTLHHVEAKAAGCPLHAARSMAPRRGAAITVSGNDGNIEYWYCETCDYYYANAEATATLTEDQIVIRAAHHLTHHEGTEATHTAAGSREYWYCDICEMYFFTEDVSEPLTGEQFKEQVTIPAASVHTPGDPVKENELKATCQAGGHYDLVTYCVEGGEELSRETVYTEADPDAHVPGEAVKENEAAATCTEPGSYDLVKYCTLCGEPTSSETVNVPAKGHTWGDWDIVRPATEEDPGEAQRVCSVCGATETKAAAEVEPVDKIVKFVNIARMQYVIDLGDGETYTIYNSSTVSWYSNEPLTFYVVTYSGFHFSDVIVYANGQELAPDENGAYTLPNNGDTVVVTVSGAVQDDSAPNGRLSFWELLLRFFRKIIAFFTGVFGKAG